MPADASGFILNLTKGEVIDLVVDNFDDGSHPLHFHGNRVWVLGEGEGYFDYSLVSDSADTTSGSTDESAAPEPPGAGLDATLRPAPASDSSTIATTAATAGGEGKNGVPKEVMRDTIVVGAYHWLAVRLRVEREGVWLVHCHNVWHFAAGMAWVLVVDDSSDAPFPSSVPHSGIGALGERGTNKKEEGVEDMRMEHCPSGQRWPGVRDEVWLKDGEGGEDEERGEGLGYEGPREEGDDRGRGVT